jgi:hypothetical protein
VKLNGNIELVFSAQANAGLSVAFDAEALSVEANRLRMLDRDFEQSDSFVLNVRNLRSLASGHFRQDGPISGSAALMVPSATNLRLYDRPAPDSGAEFIVKNEGILMQECDAPFVLIDGNEPATVRKTVPMKLQVQATEFAFHKLEVLNSGTIHIAGAGKVSSVMQGETELNETMLEEILQKPPAQKGYFGLFASLVIVASGLILKRCFDLIIDQVLPK